VTPDEVRAELREAEADLDRLRRKMDEAADAGGGAIPRELAEDFQGQMERINSRIWSLKAKLRTPVPTA